MNALLPLVGRILLALIFVISGFKKIGGFEQTAGYMTTKGLPFVEPLLVLTILIELGGGILLILGWKARWAAAAIFLFLIPVSIIFHPFWAVDAAQMQNQFNIFFKNLCIMGGMLYIIAYGAGTLSVDKGR
jgi:putative oxidoreductase